MKAITDTIALEHIAGILVDIIDKALEEHVARAKESLYIKQ
jgi:hypothetical protein